VTDTTNSVQPDVAAPIYCIDCASGFRVGISGLNTPPCWHLFLGGGGRSKMSVCHQCGEFFRATPPMHPPKKKIANKHNFLCTTGWRGLPDGPCNTTDAPTTKGRSPTNVDFFCTTGLIGAGGNIPDMLAAPLSVSKPAASGAPNACAAVIPGQHRQVQHHTSFSTRR
jgi:hypothetical protein